MENCVYILLCRNGRYYIGSAKDLNIRFSQHQSGFVQSTMNIRPIVLVFHQSYPTLKESRRAEYWLKKQKTIQILKQIIMDGIIKKDFR